MIMKVKTLLQRFSKEEDGIALTEYLILLGLLVGGVIVAVLLFGAQLSLVWDGWSAFFSGGTISAPTL